VSRQVSVFGWKAACSGLGAGDFRDLGNAGKCGAGKLLLGSRGAFLRAPSLKRSPVERVRRKFPGGLCECAQEFCDFLSPEIARSARV
jgi:hypothetical protein